jgi:putative transposase
MVSPWQWGKPTDNSPTSSMLPRGWTGHLFQSRFASVVMDEVHLLAAVFYVSLNPVRAGLVVHAADWAWSSARAHLTGKDDELVTLRSASPL